MSFVSTRRVDGYQVDALWDFGLFEPPRFIVTVTRPNGTEIGEWVVTGPGIPRDVCEDKALTFGEEQALIDQEESRGV